MTDPTHFYIIGAIVVIAMGAVKCANGVIDLYGKLKGSPPPEEMKKSHDYLVAQVGELSIDLAEIKKAATARSNAIYSQIDKVKEELVRLVTETRRELADDQKDMRKELGARQDELPSRIVALLVNTKDLNRD